MTHIKFFTGAVLPTILKIEGMTHVYTDKKFVKVSLKNTLYFAKWRKKNMKVMKNYYQSILPIEIFSLFCYN